MIIVTTAFATVFGLVRFCRGTGLGDALHRLLVEKPADTLNRGPIAFAACIVAVLMLAGFAVVAPEILPLAAAIDLTLAIELTALVFVARVNGWSRVLGLAIGKPPRLLARRLFRPASRARRPQPRRERQKAAQKDPEAWALALA